MQHARYLPSSRPSAACSSRAVLTPRDRAAIARAFKAGRDTGVESDPLAQAEAALQVHPVLLPPLPPPLTRFPQTIGAGDMPYEKGSYDFRGKGKN